MSDELPKDFPPSTPKPKRDVPRMPPASSMFERGETEMLLSAYAYFSGIPPKRMIVLQRLREARDTLDVLMADLKKKQKEKMLENILAGGTARHEKTLQRYYSLAKEEGTSESNALTRLYLSLASLTPGTKGRIHKDTIEWFLSHALKKFIVHEFQDLQKESLSRAASAMQKKDKRMWLEQSEEFEELWRMNEEKISSSDLARMMGSLNFSDSSPTLDRDAFVTLFVKHAASHLPERWFMKELCLKESRTFSSQMSLRFKSSRTFSSEVLGGSPRSPSHS